MQAPNFEFSPLKIFKQLNPYKNVISNYDNRIISVYFMANQFLFIVLPTWFNSMKSFIRPTDEI